MNESEIANEEQWLEASNVGSEYMRHEQAMQKAARVPVYKAFAIPEGYNVGMLQKMSENFKPKKIVVIEHAGYGFEIRRLADNADVKLFYSSLNTDKLITAVEISVDEVQKTEALRVVKDFLETDDETISKYDARCVEARKSSCVTYTFLQRRLAGVAVFRKDEAGSSQKIKEALQTLEDEGTLKRLTEIESQEMFNTAAVVYRINRATL